MAPESRHGYCGQHDARTFSNARAGGQIDARDVTEARGAFILPKGSGDPRKGALASSVKARNAKRATETS